MIKILMGRGFGTMREQIRIAAELGQKGVPKFGLPRMTLPVVPHKSNSTKKSLFKYNSSGSVFDRVLRDKKEFKQRVQNFKN